MSQSCSLTFLVENTSCADDVTPEHGLAVYIDLKTTRGLYDAGQTSLIAANALVMDKNLSALNWIVLSHGHYDHCGGLETVLHQTPRGLPLHCGEGALREKYANKTPGGEIYPNGCPATSAELLKLGAVLTEHPAGCEQIAPGVYLAGPAPLLTDFEKPGSRFFLQDENGNYVSDDFSDERSLIIDTSSGIVVLTGCAHRGPINIMRHAASLFPHKRVRALIGGFHLSGDSDEVLEAKVKEFEKLELDAIGLAHCTGGKASKYLREAMPEKCFLCPAGTELEFD